MRITTLAIAAAMGVAVTACAPPTNRAKAPDPFERTVKADCYTVDLFTPSDVKPHADGVPQEWRSFAGAWGGGAWEGKWCHDLYITSISPDGEVQMIETHAPFPEWNREATAFKRIGRIDDDGRLRFGYKGVRLEYWLQNGRLFGVRKEGSGEMRIKLSPKSEA